MSSEQISGQMRGVFGGVYSVKIPPAPHSIGVCVQSQAVLLQSRKGTVVITVGLQCLRVPKPLAEKNTTKLATVFLLQSVFCR